MDFVRMDFVRMDFVRMDFVRMNFRQNAICQNEFCLNAFCSNEFCPNVSCQNASYPNYRYMSQIPDLNSLWRPWAHPTSVKISRKIGQSDNAMCRSKGIRTNYIRTTGIRTTRSLATEIRNESEFSRSDRRMFVQSKKSVVREKPHLCVHPSIGACTAENWKHPAFIFLLVPPL
jgi:hypothetical protein